MLINLIFLFNIHFVFAAQSIPTPPSGIEPQEILIGDFALSEEMQTVQYEHQVYFSELSDLGRFKMSQLTEKGYRCREMSVLKGWTCRNSSVEKTIPEEIKAQLLKKWKGFLISFRSPTYSVKLPSDLETTAWEVRQNVLVRTSEAVEPQVWLKTQYVKLLNFSSFWTVCLGEFVNLDSLRLVIKNKDTLTIQDTIEVQNERESVKYVIDLTVTRIQ